MSKPIIFKCKDVLEALGKDGIRRMVRDVRLLEKFLGKEDLYIEPAVTPAKLKLERSIASKRHLPKGHVIEEKDIQLLSPGDGFLWNQRNLVLGRTISVDVFPNEIIYPQNLF